MKIEKALHMLHITALRPFQEVLLEQLLEGKDVICLAPTSAGKSLVFQVFALIMEGLVVIVEPHLALEIDQVHSMQARKIPAASINSLMSTKEKKRVLEQIQERTLRLLYITPEMLKNKQIAKALTTSGLVGLMVDEAHCIVKQGPGFREEYLEIGDFVKKLPDRPVVGAFTATATAATEEMIVKKLCLDNPFRYAAGVTRDNIKLEVIEVGNSLGGVKDAAVIEQRKREIIVKRLKKLKEGRVIVYSNTVARVEALYTYLKKKGFHVGYYHGKCEEKPRRLREFIDGRVQIMVATNAFGLGVNIPDIRLVIHHAPLIGLDDYVQEAGRAGRDGQPAEALLLWHEYDFTINERLITKAKGDLTGKELKARQDSLKALRAYAEEETACRWKTIRDFFGEEPGKRCKKLCDCCVRRKNR